MINLRKLVGGVFFCLIYSGAVVAAPDSAAGKTMSSRCVGCHGAEGNSQSSNFPILAGQKPAYIVNQLRAFRAGTRENGMMQNMASNLSNEEMNNLAAYFASVKNKGAGGDSALAKEGESKVSMCFGCHGQGAKGMGVTPRLAGQYPDYLKRQLQAFKKGTRKNGPMSGIAKMLSDDEIAAVTEHMGSLK